MLASDMVLVAVLLGAVGLIVWCPLFKPWFGFKRPRR